MATLTKDLPPFSSNEDDSSLKRNTDCVYFLASPLTCKKGSECDFRHSESARNNPRDCYYWLNGSCLNPKCAFRHPPLDGLVPPQAGIITGPSPPVPPSGPPAATKQATPCIFFQQGFCLKADRCPFLHGPVPLPKTKIWPNPATALPTEAPTFRKTFEGAEKFTQNKMGFHITAPKAVEPPRRPQPNGALQVALARPIHETPKYKEAAPPVDNVHLRSRTARLHQNRREVDDSLRESSPGFDVLVDDKLGKDEYYDDEENYARMRSREVRKPDEVDLDNYRSKRGYNSYNGSQDEFSRDSRGASSERLTAYDRRGPYKSESTDFIQNSSDLRHRLSKQRKGNGLRSVVSPVHKPDYVPEDRRNRSSRRDSRSPVHDRPVGSRLQGRINLPRRSPPLSRVDMYSERDNENGRNIGRSSLNRSEVSSHQGRLRERLSGRTHDDTSDRRTFRGRMGNDSTVHTNSVELYVPRRLSEIRGTDHIDNKPQQLTGENVISFDGPKPLSEILKKKRKVGTIASTNVVNFDDKEGGIIPSESDIKQGDEEEGEISNKKVKLIEEESSLPTGEKHPEEEESSLPTDEKHPEEESSLPTDEKHPEEEYDILVGNGEENEEEYDQGEGEDDYEQDDDVEGYNLNEEEIDEGDVADNEDFMDEDDGDDFAKKLGVSF